MADVEAAFAALLREHGARSFRLAVLLAGDVTGGEDLLQTVHEQLYRHYRKHGVPDSPEHYLRAALVKAASRLGRLRARRPETLVSEPPERISVEAEPAVLAREQLLPSLRELPPRQRAVLVLRYFADLSEEETAAMLGCSVGTVKTHAHRALHRLRMDDRLSMALSGLEA